MVTAIALVLWASPVPAETRSNNPFGNLFQDFGAPRLQGQTVGRHFIAEAAPGASGGPGSGVAARMAVEAFGGEVLGR